MKDIKKFEVDLMENTLNRQKIESIAEKQHLESESSYISYKERHDKSTKYLDEKRKSFPIRKGHECNDLAAAVKAWGRYKGSMTHDQFKTKVKRMMNQHSCPIPESWKKE